MKIIVDSNIVFSAILNTKSNIGQLIINGSRYFEFYTVGLLKEEVLNHKEKITDLTNYTEDQFAAVFQLITSKIVFVDDILLKDNDLAKAIELVSNVDQGDALFVALTNQLIANLWTGDKRLVNGLKKKGYSRVITTDELYEIFLDKQLKFKRKRK
jgi:predicted nucleic acid-binding protein